MVARAVQGVAITVQRLGLRAKLHQNNGAPSLHTLNPKPQTLNARQIRVSLTQMRIGQDGKRIEPCGSDGLCCGVGLVLVATKSVFQHLREHKCVGVCVCVRARTACVRAHTHTCACVVGERVRGGGGGGGGGGM
jgi:hypothetical protein